MFPTGKQLRRLFRDEDGLAAMEYAVMLALIIIVSISAVRTLTNVTDRTFLMIVRSVP